MKLLTNREYMALQQDITDAMQQAKDERIKRLAAEARALASEMTEDSYKGEYRSLFYKAVSFHTEMIVQRFINSDLAWQLWGYELRYGKQG